MNKNMIQQEKHKYLREKVERIKTYLQKEYKSVTGEDYTIIIEAYKGKMI